MPCPKKVFKLVIGSVKSFHMGSIMQSSTVCTSVDRLPVLKFAKLGAFCFNRLLSKFMVTQHVSEPTHKCGGVQDFVLTAGGSSNIVRNLQICADDYSDHFPIIADLTIRAEKDPLRIHVQTQKFTPDTVRVLNRLIGNSADLNKIYSCSDVNDAVSLYNNSVKSMVLSIAPVLSKTITARRGSVGTTRNLVI